jgi:hypothetical protein
MSSRLSGDAIAAIVKRVVAVGLDPLLFRTLAARPVRHQRRGGWRAILKNPSPNGACVGRDVEPLYPCG